VLRALDSKPEHRYQDAAEIKRDIEAILAGPLVPAAARADWPCVRFTIPRISWMGARVEGEMYRDETTLILDFGVVSSMGSSTHKEVRVPLADLMMISLHKGTRPNLPHWLSAWVPPKPEIEPALQWGYLVLTAETGHDAIGMLERPLAPVDVILLDAHLPDVDGPTIPS
jgi:hypothetical protein